MPNGWKLRANSFQAAAFPCQPSAQNITNDLVCDGSRNACKAISLTMSTVNVMSIVHACVRSCAAILVLVHSSTSSCILFLVQFHWGELQHKNRPRWKRLQRHPKRRGLRQRRRCSHGLDALCIKKTRTKHVKDMRAHTC